MTPRMWLRTFLAVKRGVDVSYDKDLERVLVETRNDLARIKSLPQASVSLSLNSVYPVLLTELQGVIDKLDVTIDVLKNRKLNPFNIEDKP